VNVRWLENLPPGFLDAVRSGGLPLAILGDWLEDSGREADAAEVRRLAERHATLPELTGDMVTVLQLAMKGVADAIAVIGPRVEEAAVRVREMFANVPTAAQVAEQFAAALRTDTLPLR
jgi:hypothetical protein